MKIETTYRDIRKKFFQRLLIAWLICGAVLSVLILQHITKSELLVNNNQAYTTAILCLPFIGSVFTFYIIWFFFKELDQLTSRLKRKIEDQERVLATMSHELRTPLNGILGMTQLMLETPLNAEQLDFAKTTLHSGQNMLRLINDLLDLSKIDAGKMLTEQIDFNLSQLMYDVVDLLLVQSRQKNIELVRYANPSCRMTYRGDPSRIRQILLNLVGNAIKFTDHGYVCLHATAVESPPWPIEQNEMHGFPTRGLLFRIEDTGPGISKAEQEKLFKFYAQANESTSRIFGGTGLGLALSKALAKAMGGDIICESEEGKGSIFKCYIPLNSLTDAPMFSLPFSFPDEASLWVFESNPRNCRGIEEIGSGLKMEHHTSTTWDMLAQAESAKQAGKNVILQIDYRMLGTRRLAEMLKPFPGLQKCPAILLTFKLARQLDPETLKEFTAIVNKPVRVDKWIGAIIRCSDLGKTTSSTISESNPPAPDALTYTLDQQKPITPPTTTPLPEKSRLNILLAEDNLVNQKVTVKMIEKLGDKVTVAENGIAAIHALEAGPFDLILMDCRMPEMDGLEATRVIRQQNKNIPIIALTANEGEEEREACLSSGMDEFVSKPIDMQKLSQLLAHYRP